MAEAAPSLTDKCKQADAAFQADDFEGAKELLAAVLLQLPEADIDASHADLVRSEVYFQSGRMHHYNEEWDKAYNEYKHSLEYCAKAGRRNVELQYRMSQTCLARGRISEAIGILETARSGRKQRPEVWRTLAYCYLRMDDAPQAFECASKALELAKDEPENWLLYIETAFSAKRVKEATAGIPESSVIDASEDALRMWTNLGTLRLEQQKFDEAREALSKAAELADSAEPSPAVSAISIALRYNQAVLTEKTTTDNSAVQQYLALCEENGWMGHALLKVGSFYEAAGDFDRAKQIYYQTRKEGGHLKLAELLRRQGHIMKAIETVKEAMRYAGSSRQRSYMSVVLGNLNFDMAQEGSLNDYHHEKPRYLQKALQYYLSAIPASGDCYHAVNGIGMVYAAAGNHDLALQVFSPVSEQMGDHAGVHINLGHTYMEMTGASENYEKNLQKAIKYYEKALKLEPNSIEVRGYLAQACYCMGRYDMQYYERAITILSDACQDCPDDLRLRFNLARTLEKRGNMMLEAEVRKLRSVKLDEGIAIVEKCMESFQAATSLYRMIELRWKSTPDSERRSVTQSSPEWMSLSREMKDLGDHQEYCVAQKSRAQMELDRQVKEKERQEERIQKLNEERRKREDEEKQRTEVDERENDERRQEVEDQAMRLMRSVEGGAGLGRDLENYKDSKPKQPQGQKRGGSGQAKGKPSKVTKQEAPEAGEPKQETADEDASARAEERAVFGEDEEEDEYREEEEEPVKQAKKDKKEKKAHKKEKKEKKEKGEKKDKKEKKEKKKEKKEKKAKKQKEGAARPEVDSDEAAENLFQSSEEEGEPQEDAGREQSKPSDLPEPVARDELNEDDDVDIEDLFGDD